MLYETRIIHIVSISYLYQFLPFWTDCHRVASLHVKAISCFDVPHLRLFSNILWIARYKTTKSLTQTSANISIASESNSHESVSVCAVRVYVTVLMAGCTWNIWNQAPCYIIDLKMGFDQKRAQTHTRCHVYAYYDWQERMRRSTHTHTCARLQNCRIIIIAFVLSSTRLPSLFSFTQKFTRSEFLMHIKSQTDILHTVTHLYCTRTHIQAQ